MKPFRRNGWPFVTAWGFAPIGFFLMGEYHILNIELYLKLSRNTIKVEVKSATVSGSCKMTYFILEQIQMKNHPQWHSYKVLLMEEILHHLGCIKPCN